MGEAQGGVGDPSSGARLVSLSCRKIPRSSFCFAIPTDGRRSTPAIATMNPRSPSPGCCGRLPLALELAGAYLGKWSDPDKPGFVSLSGYRERLRTKGRLATVDVGAKKLSDNELQSIHEDAVEATLRQQWDVWTMRTPGACCWSLASFLKRPSYRTSGSGCWPVSRFVATTAQGRSSLDEALRRLEDDCLVEELRRDQMRLHPLVREFAERLTPAETRDAFRLVCAGRMAAAYEDYATLEEMARKRPGVTPLEGDLLTALGFCPSADRSVQPRCNPAPRSPARVAPSPHLGPHAGPSPFPQQIRNRAFLLGLEPLVRGAEPRLAGLGQGHALLRSACQPRISRPRPYAVGHGRLGQCGGGDREMVESSPAHPMAR